MKNKIETMRRNSPDTEVYMVIWNRQHQRFDLVMFDATKKELITLREFPYALEPTEGGSSRASALRLATTIQDALSRMSPEEATRQRAHIHLTGSIR